MASFWLIHVNLCLLQSIVNYTIFDAMKQFITFLFSFSLTVFSAQTSLNFIPNFGTNPGNLEMYTFSDSLNSKVKVPLIVVLHGCSQTAEEIERIAGWGTLAKQYHFNLIFPQQKVSNNASRCFNWFKEDDISLKNGEAASILQMIDFAKTGKLSFEGLISSMIEGLIRYEMQLISTSLYQAARPGLMSFVSSVFGGYTAGGSAASNMPDNRDIGGGWSPSAKGNAFDYGIQAFAKGGAFTNSVVASPTLFKFAKGTGLMGEAGPEAIMPLTRDNQGNLGVRGGNSGGNTEVVVNNYSTAQAETKETTDSRGNRKIEVTIGDMTAGEISRSGSASQKAVGSTFGLRPQLIRR